MRKLALKSALAVKINNGDLIVLDDFTLDVPKTKTFVNFAKVLNFAGEKQLFIADYNEDTFNRDVNLDYSVRNIERVMSLDSRNLSIFWLIKQDKIVVTKEALATIEEVLA